MVSWYALHCPSHLCNLTKKGLPCQGRSSPRGSLWVREHLFHYLDVSLQVHMDPGKRNRFGKGIWIQRTLLPPDLLATQVSSSFCLPPPISPPPLAYLGWQTFMDTWGPSSPCIVHSFTHCQRGFYTCLLHWQNSCSASSLTQ